MSDLPRRVEGRVRLRRVKIALLVFGTAFSNVLPTERVAAAQAAPPWPIFTPAQSRVEGAALSSLFASIKDDPRHNLKGIVILRNGELVEEAYFNGDGPGTLHDMREGGRRPCAACCVDARGVGSHRRWGVRRTKDAVPPPPPSVT